MLYEVITNNIIDATCPFVARIHKIVYEKSSEGYTILIAGDDNHPEVEGIKGHCKSEVHVFKDVDDLKDIFNNFKDKCEKKVAIVQQTTYNSIIWDKCKEYITSINLNTIIYDTICNATMIRQAEASELAKQSDLMLIVGGKQSSNTIKLRNNFV